MTWSQKKLKEWVATQGARVPEMVGGNCENFLSNVPDPLDRFRPTITYMVTANHPPEIMDQFETLA